MDDKELAQRFGLDLEALKKEQIKLAKGIGLKDSQDFSVATRFGAIETIIVNNRIISVVIVCDKEFNIIEQQYFLDKLRFPYLNEFRSYREMPSIVEAYNKLNEKPDVVFIRGHGITHPSHFALFTGVPTIGVSENLFDVDSVDEKKDEILKDGKKVGMILKSKKKANPLYISVGSKISLPTAYNLTKSFIQEPHKMPEPLHLAHKYARSVKEELKL